MQQLSGIMDNHYVREEWICENCGKITTDFHQGTECLHCTYGYKKVWRLDTKTQIIIKDGSHVFIQK